MVTINWRTGLPSDGSLVGLGAKDIRGQKLAIVEGLRASTNVFNRTDPLKPGSARPYVDVASNLSSNAVTAAGSSFTDGKLFFGSDTSRFYLFGSFNSQNGGVNFQASDHLIGTPRMLEHATAPGKGVWVQSSGHTQLTTPNGRSTFSYTGAIIYDGLPQVIAFSSSTDYLVTTVKVESHQFEVRLEPIFTGGSNMTLFWMSSGTSSGIV